MSRLLGLCIGVDTFDDPAINRLRYAESDASAVHAVLTAMSVAGDGRSSCRRLIGREATRRAIELTVSSWLGREAKPDDVVVLYFAGHGSPEDIAADYRSTSARYLVPYDAKADDLYATGISMERVRDWFNDRIQARAIIAIFDCCFSGAAGGRTFALAGGRKIVGGDPTDIIGGNGRAIVTATNADQVAMEDRHLEGGVFTCYLLDYLLHEGRERHPSGIAPLDDLYRYVHDKVSEHSSQRLKARMTPVLNTKIVGGLDLYLPSATRLRNVILERPRFPWRQQRAVEGGSLDPLLALRTDIRTFNEAKAKGLVNLDCLQGANLRNLDLQGADLSGMDLGDAELVGANLTDVRASNTAFRRAFLQNAILRRADLSGADFTDAWLQGTRFDACTMEGCKFGGARLREVRLERCTHATNLLENADADEATLRSLRSNARS